MPHEMLAAGLGGAVKLPPHVLAALVPLLVLVLALDAYCLIDVARAKSVRNAPKLVWVIVILFVSAPIGALIYLFAGRDRSRPHVQARTVPGAAGHPSQASSAGPGHYPSTGYPSYDPSTTGHAHLPANTGPVPGDHKPIVATSSLTRDYGGTGLFDVDLAVPRGSVYGLVGPNGAGKTTLLSILSGVRRADHGTVDLSVGRSKVAVCPDVPEFDGWLTAFEVVDLARALVGTAAGSQAAGSQAVIVALGTAGLADSADRRVGGFSRGMVQRLGLACALVCDPELLILDEPTSALDPAGRVELLNLVAAMRGTRTVIFSSHILADVQRIADQVGILRDGRLLYQGGTRELIDTYLRPSWLIRIAGDAAPVANAMRDQAWVTRVEPAGPEAIMVDASSIEAGERGIPAVIAACGARQISCEPAAADLESAFLALTGPTMAASR